MPGAKFTDPDAWVISLAGIRLQGWADGEILTYKWMSKSFGSVAGTDGREGDHVLWPTGRPVDGPGFIWPSPVGVREPEPPAIDETTGRPITSINGDDDQPF